MTDPPSSSDRRVETRHFACFPVHVRPRDGSTCLALNRNLSMTGALLLMHGHLEVGERVGLSLYLSGRRDDALAASGRVLRVEPRHLDRADVWTHRVAVQFDAPLPDCRAALARMEASQAELELPRD